MVVSEEVLSKVGLLSLWDLLVLVIYLVTSVKVLESWQDLVTLIFTVPLLDLNFRLVKTSLLLMCLFRVHLRLLKSLPLQFFLERLGYCAEDLRNGKVHLVFDVEGAIDCSIDHAGDHF